MAERHRAGLTTESSTVEVYVQKLMDEVGIPMEEAAASLVDRVEAGELRLVDPAPPTAFTGYMFSLYSAWFWLVAAALLVTLLSVYVFPGVPPFSWLRVGAGFLTALYLPGYAFIEALYPQRDELEELERFALSVGLSLALTPLTGFVLNYTPWGIRIDPIITALTLLTLALGVAAVYRRYQYHMLALEKL